MVSIDEVPSQWATVISQNLSYFVPFQYRESPVAFPTSAGLICAGEAFVALASRISLSP